jgi:DNA helicase-2/ATP-dependent DNA helicase PcrA
VGEPSGPKGSPAYLERLNPMQREAVVHEGAPLLILAGAGSGKTRVITTKIAWLIDQRAVSPRSILAVTFTNKAAQEMKDRVLALVPHADDVMVRTFHSFGAWFLRRNAAAAGLEPRFTIYDEEDSVTVLRGLFGKGEDRSSLRRTLEEISRVKDIGLGPGADREAIAKAGCDPDVFAAYEKAKAATGNVDFGDLILMPLQLLKSSPAVRERTRQRFSVILVDEYQDSNVAQFELLRELWSPAAYLCVVGDDDQSIYRFRGAEVGNILSFPKVFPGTQIVRLERNYRSTQAILDVASAVVSHNKGRLGKTLWTENDKGELPVLFRLEDQDEESKVCGDLARDGFPGTTAILYRMNAQSLHFEKHFLRLGIRFRLIGSVSFYKREEVKDAMAYLSLMANHNDAVSFERIVNRPARGLGAASVQSILGEWRAMRDSAAAGADLVAACRKTAPRLSARARAGLKDLLALLQELGDLMEQVSLSELTRTLLTRSGLMEMHRLRDVTDSTSRADNLRELVSDMTAYGTGADALIAYLETVSLASAVDREEGAEGARLFLITLHNTKGLEFDRVIITGLEEGIFPHDSSSSAPEDIEEERRLFYVGITRARERLVLTTCQRRRLFGRFTEMSPSRFLGEIPPEAMQAEEEEEGGGRALRAGGRALRAGGEGDFPRGCGVYHDEYGPGMVERSWYTDGSLVVEVRFTTGRVGRFLPKYSRLERIELST